MGIIKSILDLDLYKLSMAWAVMQKYPEYEVEYQFQNRSKHQFRNNFDKEIKEEIIKLSKLSLTQEEENYLRNEPSLSFLPELFIQWLRGFRYDPTEVNIYLSGEEPDNLKITIKGYWFRTIMWETTLMSIISELEFKNKKVNLNEIKNNAIQKAQHFYYNNEKVAEMGTRRRFSYEVQDTVIQGLLSGMGKKSIVGTSNVHFAMKYNIKPIGTIAHEFIAFHGALVGYRMANKIASESWLSVYKNGKVGTYLPDTFGVDAFLKTFDYKMATLFTGLRHDSGDPFKFGNKIIKKYKELGINPKTKTLIFSDGLSSFDEIDKIQNKFDNKINISFGIGTWLTNDIENVEPLKIVIKMTGVKINNQWVPVIKLSDDNGKHSGLLSEVRKAKITLDIENNDSVDVFLQEKLNILKKEIKEIENKL